MGNVKTARYFYIAAMASVVVLLFALALIILPIHSASSTFATPTPSDTSITLSVESVSFSMELNGASNTFAASSPASISVDTNNYTGYTLSIKAKEDNEDNTKLVNSNDSSYAFTSITEPTANGDGFSGAEWGILPSKLDSGDNTNYVPAPTYDGSTIDATNAANSETNSYTLAFAAKADYSLIAGSYSNTFVVTAVANPVGYSITYNKNTEDEVANMPENQIGELTSSDVTVSSAVPSRAGYVFAGWCDAVVTIVEGAYTCATGTAYSPGDTITTSAQSSNVMALTAMWEQAFTIEFDSNGGTGSMAAQTFSGSSVTINTNSFTRSGYYFTSWNTQSDGSGTAYANQGTFTNPNDGTSSITLYARWAILDVNGAFAKNGKVKWNNGNYYALQDMNKNICADITNGKTGTLIDTRDNNTYMVGKLSDGRCWMMDSLRLNVSNSTVRSSLTASNTNATTTSINCLKNGKCSNPYATKTVSSIDASTSTYAGSEPYVYTGNMNSVKKYGSGTGSYKAGIYYNYCAASAGSYCFSDNSSGNSTQDLCPKGWRMPTGGTSGTNSEWKNVYTKSGSTATGVATALSLPLSGYRGGGGSVSNLGSGGYFWSSTRAGNWVMYNIWLDGTGGTVSFTNNNRTNYYTVRCIANN